MRSEPPVVAVTGAAGFIGRNLVVRLEELGYDVRPITRRDTPTQISAAMAGADAVFHLAGAIRPLDPEAFAHSAAYAKFVAGEIARGGRRPLVVYSSSRKAITDTDFGRAARACEEAFLGLGARGEAAVAVYRLPNVFGKWARPNYNSCVATFCHNLARGLAIRVDDPAAGLSLLYVDDLIAQWSGLLGQRPLASGYQEAAPVYETTVGGGMARSRTSRRVSTGPCTPLSSPPCQPKPSAILWTCTPTRAAASRRF
jgi:UDP-2-acetamido-2,6-beta-L-arabino-hexul-4-ose reductase